MKLGDEVRVFDVNRRRLRMPAGGWPGVVVRLGRKLVTITYDTGDGDGDMIAAGAHITQVFRLDSGRANDAYGHQHFMTVEGAELRRRKDAVRATLMEAGVYIESRCIATVEQLEAMAAIYPGSNQEEEV